MKKKNGDLTGSLNRNRFSLSLLPSSPSSFFQFWGENQSLKAQSITPAQKQFFNELVKHCISWKGEFGQKMNHQLVSQLPLGWEWEEWGGCWVGADYSLIAQLGARVPHTTCYLLSLGQQYLLAESSFWGIFCPWMDSEPARRRSAL